MRDKCFYLDFRIGSQARFDVLHRFFMAIKEEKDRIIKSWDSDLEHDQYDPANEPHWCDFLDEEAVDWFADIFDYDSDEGKTYRKLWELTEPTVRLSHSMFNLPGNWDFETMIDSLFDGEYALVDLVKETQVSGVLYYDPWAAPFGGSESLVALIESFGHRVIFDSWHEGPHRRRIVAWNYALARKLVAANKGFVPGQRSE